MAETEKPRPEDSEEEESDDELDEIAEFTNKSRTRQSVSAEAYGAWNQKKEFTPPVFEKSSEQSDRLKATLGHSFMFNELDEKDMQTILHAMKEVVLEAGTEVIKEGEDGDYLFVIEKGQLDCIKKIENQDKVVKTCSAGDVFGELALLYNCPRAATVKAKEASVCWQLDRETFNHIVKTAAVNRRERYDALLKTVDVLKDIGAYERSQIADALKPETFQKGDCVIRQDDPGDKFYIVEDGTLYAEKKVGSETNRVMDYKSGSFFGELALLRNQPRAASVYVESSSCKVLSMSRASFIKMLGPLQELLLKQAGSYA